MSARDELFAVACDDMPVTSDEVNKAIDAYAHELADKLRDRHSGTCGCGCDCSEFIDPEVS